MRPHQAKVATAERYALAEGVIWDDRAGLVRWVDIATGRVLAGELTPNGIRVVDEISLGHTVGAVALAQDGGLLVAAAHGLATVSPRGDIHVGPDLLADRSGWRLNDGIVDPQGRFLVGTLALNEEPAQDSTPSSGQEVLMRVSPNGSREILLDGVRLSNGLGFSPDGSEVYHIDTFAGTLSRHPYGPGPFDHSAPWQVVCDSFKAYPDGMTVDASGNLWVALWDGSAVLCITPDGDIVTRCDVTAPRVTCPGFAGEDLQTLVVATAMAEADKAEHDDSGALFLASVGVRGAREYRWAGSTDAPWWLAESVSDGWD